MFNRSNLDFPNAVSGKGELRRAIEHRSHAQWQETGASQRDIQILSAVQKRGIDTVDDRGQLRRWWDGEVGRQRQQRQRSCQRRNIRSHHAHSFQADIEQLKSVGPANGEPGPSTNLEHFQTIDVQRSSDLGDVNQNHVCIGLFGVDGAADLEDTGHGDHSRSAKGQYIFGGRKLYLNGASRSADCSADGRSQLV